MTGSHARLRARRDRQARFQHGLCYFCRVRMGPAGNNPDAVTLFHLDDRHSSNRGRHAGEYRTVASCRDCADYLSQKRVLNVPLEELQRRSGNAVVAEAGYQVTERGLERIGKVTNSSRAK